MPQRGLPGEDLPVQRLDGDVRQRLGLLALRHRAHADHVVVTATGELDVGSSEELERELQRRRKEGHRVVLDLRGVSFVDLVGLRTVVRACAPSDGSTSIHPVEHGSPVGRLLRLVGMEGALPLTPGSVATAGDAVTRARTRGRRQHR